MKNNLRRNSYPKKSLPPHLQQQNRHQTPRTHHHHHSTNPRPPPSPDSLNKPTHKPQLPPRMPQRIPTRTRLPPIPRQIPHRTPQPIQHIRHLLQPRLDQILDQRPLLNRLKLMLPDTDLTRLTRSDIRRRRPRGWQTDGVVVAGEVRR